MRSLALGGALFTAAVAAHPVLTAANTVPPSTVGSVTSAITPGVLAPAECAALAPTSLVAGNGIVAGTDAAELVLGGAGIDTVVGGGGDDCVMGGGGADALEGGPGGDVCVGGPGLDTFLLSCETRVQ